MLETRASQSSKKEQRSWSWLQTWNANIREEAMETGSCSAHAVVDHILINFMSNQKPVHIHKTKDTSLTLVCEGPMNTYNLHQSTGTSNNDLKIHTNTGLQEASSNIFLPNHNAWSTFFILFYTLLPS